MKKLKNWIITNMLIIKHVLGVIFVAIAGILTFNAISKRKDQKLQETKKKIDDNNVKIEELKEEQKQIKKEKQQVKQQVVKKKETVEALKQEKKKPAPKSTRTTSQAKKNIQSKTKRK